MRHISHMPQIDLSDEEHAALLAAARKAIDDDRFPMSPRLDPLKSALAKLDPGSAKVPNPPLAAGPVRAHGGPRVRL